MITGRVKPPNCSEFDYPYLDMTDRMLYFRAFTARKVISSGIVGTRVSLVDATPASNHEL
jgi:hypothetical protein